MTGTHAIPAMGLRGTRAAALALLALALAGCGGPPTLQTVAPPTAPPPGSGALAVGGILATGEVVPVRHAALGVTLPGRVAWTVAPGDDVEAGAVLLRLEASALEADVARAEAALEAAQAQLALLQAGARPEEVAAAQAEVTAAAAALALAEAQRDALTAAALEAAVADAEMELAAARAEQAAAQQAYDEIQRRKDAEEWEVETARLRLSLIHI